MEIIIILITLTIAFLPNILFLLLLRNAIRNCSKKNQMIRPNLVWLCLIPYIGFITYFIAVFATVYSLEDEFNERGLNISKRKLRLYGIAISSYPLIQFMFGYINFTYAGTIFLAIKLILLIILVLFWIEISTITKRLRRQILQNVT